MTYLAYKRYSGPLSSLWSLPAMSKQGSIWRAEVKRFSFLHVFRIHHQKQEIRRVYKRFEPDVSPNSSSAWTSPPLLPTDPTFIHVQLIPDSAERNDDKLYFFFREKSSEMGHSPVTQSRIGRICLVCTQSGVCLFLGVKRKPATIWKAGCRLPRKTSVWPTLTCWNPHVSLTFLSTMHPSVWEVTVWPLTLWSSDLISPIVLKHLKL